MSDTVPSLHFRAWHKEQEVMRDVQSITIGMCVFVGHSHEVRTWTLDEIDLMQFTGLYDKNGRMIYQGDIIKWGVFALNDTETYGENQLPEGGEESDISRVYGMFEVKWRFSFLSDLESMIYSNPDVEGVEVVGNIWQNPDLKERIQN